MDLPFGRSDGIRTHGLLVPNQARYQLRYTPIKKRSSEAAAFLVGDERIELPRAESESAALPLCESPLEFWACRLALPSTFIYYSDRTLFCQQLFSNFSKKLFESSVPAKRQWESIRFILTKRGKTRYS